MTVPEAEPAVADTRAEHDPSAATGVPAHVTILYPFLDACQIDAALTDELRQFFGAFASFRCVFRQVQQFPDVAYLEPDPETPFRDLTAAVFGHWPAHPPYAGEFDDVVPHLTLAQTEDAGVLDAVAATARPKLPITTEVTAVELWAEHSDGGWRGVARFPLAG